jgi:endonuclease YncB( thermonuclease family)
VASCARRYCGAHPRPRTQGGYRRPHARNVAVAGDTEKRLLAAMVAAFVCSPAIAADYLGKVLAVSDGDTFTMEADGAKVRVRICGIDAPERGQAGYGQAASRA